MVPSIKCACTVRWCNEQGATTGLGCRVCSANTMQLRLLIQTILTLMISLLQSVKLGGMHDRFTDHVRLRSVSACAFRMLWERKRVGLPHSEQCLYDGQLHRAPCDVGRARLKRRHCDVRVAIVARIGCMSLRSFAHWPLRSRRPQALHVFGRWFHARSCRANNITHACSRFPVSNYPVTCCV